MTSRERELESLLATAVGLLRQARGGSSALAARIDAFLTYAQPAAPARTEAERWTGKPGLPEREVLARSAAEYAQIIAELEARTEAKQAAPDAETAAALKVNADYVSNSPLSELLNQPAAPARTEACEHGQVGYCGTCCLLDEPVPTKPARAEAEQAVIEAMAAAEIEICELSCQCPKIKNPIPVCRAELARRGLK